MVVAQQKPRRWTREEYDQMVDTGILGLDDRVELIEGEILTMSPQNSPHATGTQLVAEALREAFGPGFFVRVQFPIAVSHDSEPEPDVAVVSGAPRDYREAHPTSAVLVVEVADSTIAFDRSVKKRLYARSAIPEFWLLNLPERRLEVYREPNAGDYLSSLVFGPRDSVSPLASPTATIAIADLLP